MNRSGSRRSRTLGACPSRGRPPLRRPRGVPLGVMLVVAAVMGVVVAGLAIPFVGVLGVGARQVAEAMDELPRSSRPTRCRRRPRCWTPTATRSRRSTTRTGQRRAQPDLADHGQGDRRDRGRPLLRARRARPQGHAARVDHQPGNRRGPGRLVDHPADGEETSQTQADTEEERAAATEDTYARKLRELRYAIAFEQKHTKDWILERYLNTAYFGDGAYGIQAAAQHYFDVNAKELNLRAVGDAGRHGEEPDRLRPDELARQGPGSGATSSSTGWPSSASSPARRPGRPRDELGLRRSRPRTAASTRARRSSATTRSSGCSRPRARRDRRGAPRCSRPAG